MAEAAHCGEWVVEMCPKDVVSPGSCSCLSLFPAMEAPQLP